MFATILLKLLLLCSHHAHWIFCIQWAVYHTSSNRDHGYYHWQSPVSVILNETYKWDRLLACAMWKHVVFVINTIRYSVEVTAGPYWMFQSKWGGRSSNAKVAFIETFWWKACTDGKCHDEWSKAIKLFQLSCICAEPACCRSLLLCSNHLPCYYYQMQYASDKWGWDHFQMAASLDRL